MTDWREAGNRADATRVRNLFLAAFDLPGKRLARERAIQALKAAGATCVLDLWGGGISAEALVAAGFRVISVENGSMRLFDDGRLVSAVRKRRALDRAGLAGGYETFWGSAAQALAAFPEIDGALLDFCGPWSKEVRRTVRAARHLRAAVVTLCPDHDLYTEATDVRERQLTYQLLLRMARTDKPTWDNIARSGGARLLIDYHGEHGQMVSVYLLSRGHVSLPVMSAKDRIRTRPDMRERVNSTGREWYRKQSAELRKRLNDRSRHNDHLRSGVAPRKACAVCGLRRLVICGYCPRRVLRASNARYCSEACAKAFKADYQRSKRSELAAVSGTAAEAISIEEAA
jgi:hypothetical protein